MGTAIEQTTLHSERGRHRIEQRKHPRFALRSAVTVIHEQRQPALCWVKNLSAGGALLCGSEPLPPRATLRLLLHLPWYQPIAVDCEVVHGARRSGAQRQFGVRFLHTNRSTLVAIERAIDAAERCRTQLREPVVLVLTDRGTVRQALQRDLGRSDLRWVLAETPLDAIRWLQDWEMVIDAVVVDLAYEQTNMLSFLRFLADEFPAVRRIVVADGETPTLAHVACTFGRCAAVLSTPWERSRFEQAMQRPTRVQ
jgi:ActR/RegA family two-component response regulator